MDIAAAARYVRLSGADRDASEALGIVGEAPEGDLAMSKLEEELLGSRDKYRAERLTNLRLKRKEILASQAPRQEELIALQMAEEEQQDAIARDMRERERIRRQMSGLQRQLLHAKAREAAQELQTLQAERLALAEREQEKMKAVEEAQNMILQQDKRFEDALGEAKMTSLKQSERAARDHSAAKFRRQKIVSERIALAEMFGVRLEGLRKEREWLTKEYASYGEKGKVELGDLLSPFGIDVADRELKLRRKLLADQEGALLREAEGLGVLPLLPSDGRMLEEDEEDEENDDSDDGNKAKVEGQAEERGERVDKNIKGTKQLVEMALRKQGPIGDDEEGGKPSGAEEEPAPSQDARQVKGDVDDALMELIKELQLEVKTLRKEVADPALVSGSAMHAPMAHTQTAHRPVDPLASLPSPFSFGGTVPAHPAYVDSSTQAHIMALEADTARLRAELHHMNLSSPFAMPDINPTWQAHQSQFDSGAARTWGGLVTEQTGSLLSSSGVPPAHGSGFAFQPQHTEALTELEFEMRKLEMETRLEDMKEKTLEQRRVRAKEAEHLRWMTEQKQELEIMQVGQARISDVVCASRPSLQSSYDSPLPNERTLLKTRKAVAKERRQAMGTAAAQAAAAAIPEHYDPQGGFCLWWDALVGHMEGISGKMSDPLEIRIAFGLYNGSSIVGSMQSTPWSSMLTNDHRIAPMHTKGSVSTATDPESSSTHFLSSSGVFYPLTAHMHYAGSIASPSVRIVFELQYKSTSRTGRRAEVAALPLGWGQAPVFGPYSQSPFLTLRSGFWAIPIWDGRANLNPEAAQRSTSTPGDLRVCLRLSHFRANAIAGAYLPEHEAMHMYRPVRRSSLSVCAIFLAALALARLRGRRRRRVLVGRVAKSKRRISATRRISAVSALNMRRRSIILSTAPENMGQHATMPVQPTAAGSADMTLQDISSSQASAANNLAQSDSHTSIGSKKSLDSIISAASAARSIGTSSATSSRLRGMKSKKRIPFRPGNAFDVLVEGAVGMPYGCSVSKVTLRGCGHPDMSTLEPPGEVQTISLPQSPWDSPRFNLQCSFRSKEISADTVLLLRLDTVDSDGLAAVGYAVLGAFVDANGDPTVKSAEGNGEPPMYLRLGAFELPLYHSPPDNMSALHHGCLTGMVRVPCTRLRVVIRNSKAEGLDPEPFPHIEAYNSSLAPALSDTEERLLRRHEEEKSKSCAEMARTLSEAVDDRSGGSAKTSSVAWAEKVLAGKPRRMLPLDKAPYWPEEGFTVRIAGLAGLKGGGTFGSKSMLFKALHSLLVPGLFYGDPPMLDQAEYPIAYDMSSGVNAPRFKDPPHAYTHSRYDPAQCIVIDVRQLPASADLDGSSKHGGEGKLAWGLLPVFQDNGMLKVGAHQVPLFTGAFPTELLGEDGPVTSTLEWVSQKRVKPLACASGFASAIVLLGHGLLPFPDDPLTEASAAMSTDLVSSCAKAVGSTEIKWATPLEGGESGKCLSKLVPKKVSHEDFNASANRAFARATGIGHLAD